MKQRPIVDTSEKRLPKFHQKKGKSVIVKYKDLPRILKRNRKEGRPSGTGREARLRKLRRRRHCEVFNKMLPVFLTFSLSTVKLIKFLVSG